MSHQSIYLPIPINLLESPHQPMKAAVFLEMTLHIYHSLNIIKKLNPVQELPTEKLIDLHKQTNKKLVIFDLDQTLVNLERELLPGENISSFSDMSHLVWIDIETPSTGEIVKTGFSIRPYAIECLR